MGQSAFVTDLKEVYNAKTALAGAEYKIYIARKSNYRRWLDMKKISSQLRGPNLLPYFIFSSRQSSLCTNICINKNIFVAKYNIYIIYISKYIGLDCSSTLTLFCPKQQALRRSFRFFLRIYPEFSLSLRKWCNLSKVASFFLATVWCYKPCSWLPLSSPLTQWISANMLHVWNVKQKYPSNVHHPGCQLWSWRPLCRTFWRLAQRSTCRFSSSYGG